jgi:hypothetical protein
VLVKLAWTISRDAASGWYTRQLKGGDRNSVQQLRYRTGEHLSVQYIFTAIKEVYKKKNNQASLEIYKKVVAIKQTAKGKAVLLEGFFG